MFRAMTITLVVILTGCEDRGEVDALRHRLAAEEKGLAERRAIAQNLNAYRRDHEALRERFAKAGLADSWDPHEALSSASAAVPGAAATVEPSEGGARLQLSGKDGAQGLGMALSWMEEKVPLATARRVEVRGRSWKLVAELEAPPPMPPATRLVQFAGPPLPESDWRAGGETLRLRRQIQETQAVSIELDRVLREVVKLRQQKRHLDGLLRMAEEPQRARNSAPLLAAMFTGVRPLIVEGSATIEGRKLSIDVDQGRKIAVIAEALGAEVKLLSQQEGTDAVATFQL